MSVNHTILVADMQAENQELDKLSCLDDADALNETLHELETALDCTNCAFPYDREGLSRLTLL